MNEGTRRSAPSLEATAAIGRLMEVFDAIDAVQIVEHAARQAVDDAERLSRLTGLRGRHGDLALNVWIADLMSIFKALTGRDPQGTAMRHPDWAPLILAIANDKRLSCGQAAFANFCAARNISPQVIGDTVVQRFLGWLETRTLCPKPRDVVRRVPHLWNEASDKIGIWPKIQLTTASFKSSPKRLQWGDLSENFQRDAQAYLAMRAEKDLFDKRPNAPSRLAGSTRRAQSEHLRLAASILIESGVPVEDIAALSDLVESERFKTVLRHYHKRANEQPNAFAICLAKTLIQVAKYYVGAAPEHIASLKVFAAALPPIPFDLTAKNTTLLRQFESEALLAKLIFLPDRLMAEVITKLETGPVEFVKAQVAVAIDFELAIPLRPQNLCRLNWRRHFSEPDGPKGRLILHIPKDEMKSRKKDFVAEIPNELARRLRWYRRHILSRLNADMNGDLFVTTKGLKKDQKTLTIQIITAIERHLGVHMTPHQFRHLCGILYLEENPQDIETVRALLGHAWTKTTLIYVGSQSRRASNAYSNFVFAKREKLKLKQKHRFKGKPKNKKEKP